MWFEIQLKSGFLEQIRHKMCNGTQNVLQYIVWSWINQILTALFDFITCKMAVSFRSNLKSESD